MDLILEFRTDSNLIPATTIIFSSSSITNEVSTSDSSSLDAPGRAKGLGKRVKQSVLRNSSSSPTNYSG